MIDIRTAEQKGGVTNNGFSQFSLSSDLIETLSMLNYKKPTKIQQAVIVPALNGKDIVACSQTGTGKTAAFAIPLCEKVSWEGNLLQALVLEPTRELSVQVQSELFHIGRKKRLKIPAVFGGFPIDKQIQTLRQKNHIAVGTPGRIMDHIRRGTLKLGQVKYLVIDEADLMFDMGFLDEVKQIIRMLPAEKQVMLFSATMGENVRRLAEEYMEDAVSIAFDNEIRTADVEQIICEAEPEEKYRVFLEILFRENPNRGMIFCGTREMVNVLCRKMKKDRISCGMIHGELDQAERLKTIDSFRTGRFRYLIATDVAARGIDFENITHVLNYDFPTGRETYVHRIGRTGRNGKSGKAISLVSESDKRMLRMVEEFIEKEIPVIHCEKPSSEEEKAFWARQKEMAAPKAGRGVLLNRTITRLTIGGGKKSKMRAVDIVGAVCSIPDMKAEDIGIIDIRESITYVEILNGKGKMVLETLQDKPIKGRVRKVRSTRNLS